MNTRKLIKITNLEKKIIRSSLEINKINYNSLNVYRKEVSYKNKDEKIDRQKNINKLSEVLDEKYSKKIEESIYNFSKEYTEDNETPFLLESVYSDKFNEIFNLLINQKSVYLIDAIKTDKIDSSKIAMMRPDELNPDKYEKINKKKEIEEHKKSNQATSSVFKCPKCKERKSVITQKQTRSADEPATLYIECKSCGYTTIHDDS